MLENKYVYDILYKNRKIFMKEYITVAGPKSIETIKGNVEPSMNLFANIINQYAQKGWSYHLIIILLYYR